MKIGKLHNRTLIFVALAATVGTALSVASFLAATDRERDRVTAEFDRRVGNREVYLRNGIDAHLDLLHSIRGLFAALQQVRRHEFGRFFKHNLEWRKSITYIRWLPRVLQERRAAFEAAVRAKSQPGFQITEADEQGRRFRAKRREQYFPTLFVEPFEGNEACLGIDWSVDRRYRSTMDKARDSGKAAALTRIVTDNAIDNNYACCIFLPIYRNGLLPETVKERRDALTGFVTIRLHVATMVKESLANLNMGNIRVHLYDETIIDDRHLLFQSCSGKEDPDHERMIRSGTYRSTTFDVADRRWTLLCHPSSEYFASQKTYQPRWVLACGLLLTSLGVGYMLTVANRTAEIRRLVVERTGELAATNEALRFQVEQRKQSEHNLQESEMRHRTLYESSTDAIMLTTPENGFLACNPATVKLFGCADEKEFISNHPATTSPTRQPDGRLSEEKSMEMMATAMEKGSHFFEWKHRRFDGQEFDATVLLTRMKLNDRQVLHATVRDTTEQQVLQAQLVQAQKLESLGQLSAGIAHEINTPIQYVGDNIRFLEDGFREIMAALHEHGRLVEAVRKQAVTENLLREIGEVFEAVDVDYLRKEIPAAVSQSLEGVGRVSEIVLAMKQFSHPGGENKVPADINKAISSTIIIARNEWKYVAEMETDFAEDMPPVPVLLGDFNQVILNIIVNAAQAIGECNGNGDGEKGTIGFATRLDGDNVEIRISDTGGGIPAEIGDRIFDPFFTTKEVGKGTGQGLAISHSVIVEKHGGTLTFETELGAGTTFILRLPLENENAQDDSAEQFVEYADGK